jgi:hypothetical protein
MPTLNFPTNPATNQQYSFGGKTWYWTGDAWRLLNTGAINDIPIGNVTPSTGSFTEVTVGNVEATGNITAAFLYGNGRYLTGIQGGGGGGGTNISSGNTRVDIPEYAGNIIMDVHGVPNVIVVGQTETTFAGNIVPAAGNTYTLGTPETPFAEGYFSGNSVWVGNAKISANSTSIVISDPTGGDFVIGGAAGNADLSANSITVSGNVTATNFIGNISGNITGNIVAPGSNTQVLFNDGGQVAANADFTFNKTTSNVTVGGNISATGNITGTYLLGNGSALGSVMADRGVDTNNWNTLTQMGVYTVNRTSWSGTTGTPIDSQIFVGLLEVKNSTDTAIEQIFYPGTVEVSDEKLQWNRAYWNGSWTAWVKIVNDFQVVEGGDF